MNDLRARSEPSGRLVDGHVTAAACLGVALLAGTGFPGLLTSGPPFAVVGLADAVSERGDRMREAAGRQPSARFAPADRHIENADDRPEAVPSQPVDINRADVTALQALPGVGPALARRIVAHREAHGPFGSPADLLQVSGVGAKRYARLEGRIATAGTP